MPVSHRLVDLGGPPSPTENQPKSKEVKKANKFLKSIDKDITRVKNNLGPVEGEGEDEGMETGGNDVTLGRFDRKRRLYPVEGRGVADG